MCSRRWVRVRSGGRRSWLSQCGRHRLRGLRLNGGSSLRKRWRWLGWSSQPGECHHRASGRPRASHSVRCRAPPIGLEEPRCPAHPRTNCGVLCAIVIVSATIRRGCDHDSRNPHGRYRPVFRRPTHEAARAKPRSTACLRAPRVQQSTASDVCEDSSSSELDTAAGDAAIAP